MAFWIYHHWLLSTPVKWDSSCHTAQSCLLLCTQFESNQCVSFLHCVLLPLVKRTNVFFFGILCWKWWLRDSRRNAGFEWVLGSKTILSLVVSSTFFFTSRFKYPIFCKITIAIRDTRSFYEEYRRNTYVNERYSHRYVVGIRKRAKQSNIYLLCVRCIK